MDPNDYFRFQGKRASGGFFKGRAVALHGREEVYVVLIMSKRGQSIPGMSAQQVILVGRDGRLLDKLVCHINSRYGELGTEVRVPSDSDGAQILIVFHPMWESGRHHWHEIIYGNKSFRFQEGYEKQTVWSRKGLCRVKIADDKFVVLFPELKIENDK
jgi:hypothetical protein